MNDHYHVIQRKLLESVQWYPQSQPDSGRLVAECEKIFVVSLPTPSDIFGEEESRDGTE